MSGSQACTCHTAFKPINKTASCSLIVYDFKRCQIRVFTDEQGEPWLSATDVCNVLGIANPRQAMTQLDDDPKGVYSTSVA